QSSIACAASGKAGGFLALDWCDGGPVSALARASFNLHRSLAEELPAGRFPVRRQVGGCVVQEGGL
ncbi:hypothetical protein Tco_0357663, partial [Tanacetum coccineum]